MKISDKQTVILQTLQDKESMSKSELMEELQVNRWYYANYEKHFGEILSRMVNSGLIDRISKGKFKFKSSKRISNYPEVAKNQTELFL